MERLRRIKSIVLAVTVCAAILMMNIFTFAYDDIEDPEEINQDWINVNVIIDGTYGYPDDITVYMDRVPIEISYDEFVDGICNTQRPVAPGEHKVSIISFSDLGDYYDYTYPEIFDPSKDTALKITVKEGAGALDMEEDFDYWDPSIAEYYETVEAPSATELDFSDGKEYATVNISADFCAAALSITYSLMGEEIYDIVLDTEHGFKAIVKLPPGSYKELALTAVEMDKDVLDKDITYSLAHKDKMLYGNVYDFAAGETASIDDLQLMMNVGGYVTEADSGFLFKAKGIQNLEAGYAQRAERKLREFDLIEEQSEPATIAIAEPEIITDPDDGLDREVNKSDIIKAILLAGIPVILLIAYFIIRKKLKDKENE